MYGWVVAVATPGTWQLADPGAAAVGEEIVTDGRTEVTGVFRTKTEVTEFVTLFFQFPYFFVANRISPTLPLFAVPCFDDFNICMHASQRYTTLSALCCSAGPSILVVLLMLALGWSSRRARGKWHWIR